MTPIDGKVGAVVLALLELGILCWFGKVDGAAMATAAQVLVGGLVAANLVEGAAAKVAEYRIAKMKEAK